MYKIELFYRKSEFKSDIINVSGHYLCNMCAHYDNDNKNKNNF